MGYTMALLSMMARKYDVIIVGGGPAGIFAPPRKRGLVLVSLN
ncbi:hypothetical protein ACFLT4_04120 [Chloroflexota bacterium]